MIAEYEKLANMLDQLLDRVGDNESHHEPLQQGSGIDALKFLMEQHELDQSDFKKEIGSQGVVSEILNGKRQLNLSHIKNSLFVLV